MTTATRGPPRPAIVNLGDLRVERSVVERAEDGVLNHGTLAVVDSIIRDIERDGLARRGTHWGVVSSRTVANHRVLI